MSDELWNTRSTPVRLEITIPQNGLFIEYNIYDFTNLRPDVSIYDIHDCFNTTNRQTFQITFEAPGGYYPDNGYDYTISLFRDLSIFALSRITTLPPLRFQRTHVDHNTSNIFVTTTMVENAAVPHYFTHIINGSVADHADKVVSTQGADTALHCAQLCYEGFVNLTCNSFYFCPGQNECLFSRKNAPSSNGPKPNVVPGCQSYSRTVTSRDAAPLTNQEAFTLLKNTVYLGKMKINNPTSIRGRTFTAMMVNSFPGTQNRQSEAMHHFSSFKTNFKTKDFDSSFNHLSLDECALACTSMLDYQCQGFTYCDGLFTCTLVKARPELLDSSAVVQADGCYIYQRRYLDDYIASPGTVSMTTADSTIPSVTSSDDCAKQCTQSKSLVCQSFEYCQDSKQCLLFNGLTLGHVSEEAASSCQQFKRSFLAEFQATNGGTFVFNGVVQYTGVSVTQCAQLCVEQEGAGCHGFYFCDKVAACHLTAEMPGQLEVQLDSLAAFCNFYARQGINSTTPQNTITTTLNTGSKNPATSSIRPQPSSSTHSTTRSPGSRSVSTTTPTSSRSSSSTKVSVASSISSSTTNPSTGSSTASCVGATQKQSSNDSSKMKSGAVVGVAFATFIIGLVIGVAVFFVFNRLRTKKHDEIEMHLTKQSH